MSKTETSGDDAAEERSTPINWRGDPATKAKRRRYSQFSHLNADQFSQLLQNPLS